MVALSTQVMRWMRGEKGASMVEYALLIALIAIVALVAVAAAGGQLSETFSEVSSALEDAGS